MRRGSDVVDAGDLGYAIVYTVILEPLTPQNTVNGAASGAMAPVLGCAAITGDG